MVRPRGIGRAALAFACLIAAAGGRVLINTLNGPSPLQDASGYGTSVAVSGDYAAVGAVNWDNVGSAFLFKWQSDEWVLTSQLFGDTDAKRLPGNFACALAISNDYLVVGAQDNDVGGTVNAGAVYVYSVDSGVLVHKLTAEDPTRNSHFGAAVDVTNYGRIIVGAPGEVDANNDASSHSAYVFDFDGDSSWVQMVRLSRPPPAVSPESAWASAASLFGATASIVDGRAVVGDPYGFGAAYVFELDTHSWTWALTATLTAGDTAPPFSYFGSSISLRTNRVAIGAYDDYNAFDAGRSGSVYVFDYQTGGGGTGGGNSWVQTQKITAEDSQAYDRFGAAVSLSDNAQLVIGASRAGDGDEGSAYLFELQQNNSTSSWIQTEKFVALNPSDSQFGYAVGISCYTSGRTIIIGAPAGLVDGKAAPGGVYLDGTPPGQSDAGTMSFTAFHGPSGLSGTGAVKSSTAAFLNYGYYLVENYAASTVTGTFKFYFPTPHSFGSTAPQISVSGTTGSTRGNMTVWPSAPGKSCADEYDLTTPAKVCEVDYTITLATKTSSSSVAGSVCDTTSGVTYMFSATLICDTYVRNPPSNICSGYRGDAVTFSVYVPPVCSNRAAGTVQTPTVFVGQASNGTTSFTHGSYFVPEDTIYLGICAKGTNVDFETYKVTNVSVGANSTTLFQLSLSTDITFRSKGSPTGAYVLDGSGPLLNTTGAVLGCDGFVILSFAVQKFVSRGGAVLPAKGLFLPVQAFVSVTLAEDNVRRLQQAGGPSDGSSTGVTTTVSATAALFIQPTGGAGTEGLTTNLTTASSVSSASPPPSSASTESDSANSCDESATSGTVDYVTMAFKVAALLTFCAISTRTLVCMAPQRKNVPGSILW